MTIRFSRAAGDARFSITKVLIPLSILQRSLGAVELSLRDLPHDLYTLLSTRYTEERGSADVLKEIVAWGVAGHRAEDFVEEDNGRETPLPYKSKTVSYMGRDWSVASDETIALYESVLPRGVFLFSIKAALDLYHAGHLPTPDQLWELSKPREAKTKDPLAPTRLS
jgi:hypothetical protein